MFLLGHACWSYLFSKATGRKLNVNLPAYLALLSGILPDFDIYFQPYLVHHTYTHSLIIVIPVIIVLTYFFGRLGFAFSIGILSHLLADFLVGSIPLLYPFYSSSDVGLNLGIPSLADTILELGAFALVLFYAYRNGDYRLLLKPSRDSLLLGIPLFALVTLTLLFAGDRSIPLAEFAFSRRALTVITLGHILLSGILALGVLQGFRWYYRSRRQGQTTNGKTSHAQPPWVTSGVTRRLNPPTFKQLLRTGVWSIQLLEWWNIPRRGWIIILSELAVIVGLAGWAYSEYLNNTYFQTYVNSLSPVLVPIVSVGFGITSATVATLLYFTMKNMKQRERPREEDASARRASPKKTIKKPVSASARERASTAGPTTIANPRVPVGGASRPKRMGTQPGNAETSDSA